MFVVDSDKCDGCETCIDECPAEAIKLENEKAIIDSDECSECGVCVDECPNAAISEK